MTETAGILKDRRKRRSFHVVISRESMVASLEIEMFQAKLEDYLAEELPAKELAWAIRQGTIQELVLKAHARAWARIIREAKDNMIQEVG
jgi:hypothetical protein